MALVICKFANYLLVASLNCVFLHKGHSTTHEIGITLMIGRSKRKACWWQPCNVTRSSVNKTTLKTYSRANLRWRVKALLKITHLWTRLDEFWSYLLDQRKFFISSLHLSNWFFEIIHLVMTQGKICFITFLKKRRHDWHLVNSRSNWDHFKNWEQTPSDFWPQIQAKIGSSSLSSNKLVLITWFCNHQMIFNFSESLLIFRSQLAPSV